MLYSGSRLSYGCFLCHKDRSNCATSAVFRFSSSKSHYQTLGVKPTATQKEIKVAYIRLSKELHPDRKPDSQQQQHDLFVQLNEAYSVLSKLNTRYQYDRSRDMSLYDSYRASRMYGSPPMGHGRSASWRNVHDSYDGTDFHRRAWQDFQSNFDSRHAGTAPPAPGTGKGYYGIPWVPRMSNGSFIVVFGIVMCAVAVVHYVQYHFLLVRRNIRHNAAVDQDFLATYLDREMLKHKRRELFETQQMDALLAAVPPVSSTPVPENTKSV